MPSPAGCLPSHLLGLKPTLTAAVMRFPLRSALIYAPKTFSFYCAYACAGCFQIEQRPRELQCTTSLNLESLPASTTANSPACLLYSRLQDSVSLLTQLQDDLWLPPHVQAGLLTEHETEEFDASLAEGQHCNSPPAQLNTQNSSCGTRRSLRPRKHPSRAALSDEEQVCGRSWTTVGNSCPCK